MAQVVKISTDGIIETVEEDITVAVPPVQVSRITAGQFRQQLIYDDTDSLVVSAIEAVPDEKKRKLILARYEYESFFNIDDPDLLLLAGAIGYDTSEKIQEFFNKASLL